MDREKLTQMERCYRNWNGTSVMEGTFKELLDEIETLRKALSIFAKTSMSEVRPTRHEHHIGWQGVDGEYGVTRLEINEAMKIARAVLSDAP